MKLFVIFAAVACCNAAKLDKTYLPPSHSQSSGGSSNFLQAPFAGSAERLGQGNGFGRSGNGFGENRNSFAQNGNGFAPSGNSFIQNDNNFAQNGNGFAQNGNNQANDNEYTQNADNGFGNFENRPERPQAAFERNASILRQDNQNDGETYAYAYETENGIFAEENGVATNGVEALGGYSYTGDDGQVYSIRYTADQNGFVPQGDHLPTPPPIPEEILKALEQNARDEAAGIYDDGSYNEGKYSNGDDQYNNNANSINNGNAYNNQNQYNDDDDSVVTDNAFYRNSGADRFNNGADEDFNGANQGGFRNAAAGQSVNKAYLPPFAAQRSSNGPNFGSRSRQPSFSARNGYRY